MQITATYSPEDNKLRLYASARLDAETYARVKAAGYVWAPKQGLFVAPAWSVSREDLAIELAGEIEPEEMTIAERAQAKAERLENLAHKRARQASAFHNAAQDISERFAMGQPILIGHHSQRRAEKDRERMQAASAKATKSHEAANYWLYRADGVEAHANHKNDPRTRARRIETLLAELRDLQRTLNQSHRALEAWTAATTPAAIDLLAGMQGYCGMNDWSDLRAGKISPDDLRAKRIASSKAGIESPRLARWIAHTLNRLAYERELLGPVSRYSGEITPTVLQMFVRAHGADKPKGAALGDGLFSVECESPLPAHIALGNYAEMTGDEWRDLMQACGYEVPAKKDAKPPILNFRAPQGAISTVNPHRRQEEILRQIEMTAAEYAKQGEGRGTRLSTCGGFRVRVGLDYSTGVARYMAPRCAVLITDQKAHPVPNSVTEYDLREAAE